MESKMSTKRAANDDTMETQAAKEEREAVQKALDNFNQF